MEGTTVAGHAIDVDTEGRLKQLATEEGVELAEAIEMVLHVGLEFCESHVVQRRDQLADLAGEIRDIKACLHLAGRAALASNLLLAHWASKSGGVRVSEEDLTRELDAVGRSRWADQLAQLGIPTPVDGLE